MHGHPCVLADAIQIDIIRPSFDRTVEELDDLAECGLSAIAAVLERLRLLLRTGIVRAPSSAMEVTYLLQILDDHGNELLPEPDKLRTRAGARWSSSLATVSKDVWTAVEKLPVSTVPQPWDDLLLDAPTLLPQQGPALVLAYTAVEVRITTALDQLAETGAIDPNLWKWITDRRADKAPTVRERLTILLESLIGQTLSAQGELWQKWLDLHAVRNNFVHQGRAHIREQDVDDQMALSLITNAARVVEWITSLLPGVTPVPAFDPEKLGFQVTRTLFEAAPPETTPGDSHSEGTVDDDQ